MTENRINEFIKLNADFWENHEDPESNELLLVETSNHSVMNHSNAVTAKMIATAKKLKIAWFLQDNSNTDLMKSYSKNSIFIKHKELKFYYKLLFLSLSVFYYLYYSLFINRILSFKHKGISYGDFVYDIYLASFSMATLHRFDFRIIKVFYRLFEQDRLIRIMLSNYLIKAILLTHMMGLKTGLLARVALQHSVPVYLKTGGHNIFSLAVYKSLDEVDYWGRPSLEMLNTLIKECPPDIIEKEFDEFIDEETKNQHFGPLTLGYGNQLTCNLSKEDFLKQMNLKNKPIIFVMLHSFNDHPHSHFKKMLFRDYYDWFIQTYRYALKDKSKNWIFKQHPLDTIFYKTTDCNMPKIFSKIPDHIRFIPYNSEIKASSVLNIADGIVTCLSTAGLEMPAFKGMPSIIAGNTFYDGFGFTIEPETKKEYFRILNNLNLQKLSYNQQLRAKCCYLYVNSYINVPFAAGPPILYDGKLIKSGDESYYARVLHEAYKEKANIIFNQFDKYVKEIAKSDFKRLIKLPSNLT